jgi:hypothetical protein
MCGRYAIEGMESGNFNILIKALSKNTYYTKASLGIIKRGSKMRECAYKL